MAATCRSHSPGVRPVADISKLRGLDAPVRARETDRAGEFRQRVHQRGVNDFLQELANMQDQRRYSFAGDTIEGIYTTVEHSGYVTDGQRRAINNIRKGCREGEI
jgi:hypothetical protein